MNFGVSSSPFWSVEDWNDLIQAPSISCCKFGIFGSFCTKEIIHGLPFLDLSRSLMCILTSTCLFFPTCVWMAEVELGGENEGIHLHCLYCKIKDWIHRKIVLMFTIWSGQCTRWVMDTAPFLIASLSIYYYYFWVVLLWNAIFSLSFFWVMLLWHAIFSSLFLSLFFRINIAR